MNATVINEVISGAAMTATIEAFFNAKDNLLEREMEEQVASGTPDPKFLEQYNAFCRKFVSVDYILIAIPHNQESLCGALFVNQWFLLTRTVPSDITGLSFTQHGRSFYTALQRTDDNERFLVDDASMEVVVCSSFERTMELMEESQARGDHLFVPTAAGAA